MSYPNTFFFKNIDTFKDKNDKPLSLVTKKIYKDNLKWLIACIQSSPSIAKDTIKKINILWMISNPIIVHHVITIENNCKNNKPFSSQTIMSFLSTFMSIFSHIPEIKQKYLAQYEEYKIYFSKIYDIVLKANTDGIFTEKQDKGFVEWSDIVKKRQELANTKYASKEHLILALYTYIPPLRQDFGFVKILFDKPPLIQEKGNYIVLSKTANKPSFLVLNDYKTTKTFPQYRKDLPKPLVDIIIKSLEMNPREYLFVNSEGLPFKNKKRYGENINRTLLSIFGVPLTPSLIRHSETIFERTLNLSPAQEEQMAKDMRHSLTVHNRYRLSESYFTNKNPDKLEDASGDIFTML